MTVQERRAWIPFAAAALSKPMVRCAAPVEYAAQAGGRDDGGAAPAVPRDAGRPRAPNRKPRWRREARKAENEARRAASLGEAGRVPRTTRRSVSVLGGIGHGSAMAEGEAAQA